MATAALVDRSNIDLGRRVIAALTRESIPVAVGLWAFASQSEEWQLTIATPLVDEVGPLSAYGKVQKALQKHNFEDEFPLRRIYLKSPKDRVLRMLQQESRALGREDYRLVNAPIAGNFVEDAYLYTGFIHILRDDQSGEESYLLVYAPSLGPKRGRARVLNGIASVRRFLDEEVHLPKKVVESKTKELLERGGVSIPNVPLEPHDLKRLRLA